MSLYEIYLIYSMIICDYKLLARYGGTASVSIRYPVSYIYKSFLVIIEKRLRKDKAGRKLKEIPQLRPAVLVICQCPVNEAICKIRRSFTAPAQADSTRQFCQRAPAVCLQTAAACCTRSICHSRVCRCIWKCTDGWSVH